MAACCVGLDITLIGHALREMAVTLSVKWRSRFGEMAVTMT
jgi:hypothetical protein